MSNQTPDHSLLGLAKSAVSAVAENLAEGAHKAIHKLEELAPAAVAGPVHAVAEAADALLPHSKAAEAETKPTEAAAKPAAVAAKPAAAPVAQAARQEPAAAPVIKLSAARAPKPNAVRATGTDVAAPPRKFKVKRGQKH